MDSATGAKAVTVKRSSSRGMESPALNTRRGWSPKMADAGSAQKPESWWLITTTGPGGFAGCFAKHATRESGCWETRCGASSRRWRISTGLR
jgi:hypothetical protein